MKVQHYGNINNWRRNRVNIVDLPLLNNENLVIYPETCADPYLESGIVEPVLVYKKQYPNSFPTVGYKPLNHAPPRAQGTRAYYNDTNSHRLNFMNAAVDIMEMPMR